MHRTEHLQEIKQGKTGNCILQWLLLAVACIFLVSPITALAAAPSWYQVSVEEKALLVGERAAFTFTNTDQVTYTFSSSRPDVIRISKRRGVMKAVSKGTAVITITARQKTEKGTLVYRRKKTFTVSQAKLSRTSMELKQSKTRQLTVKGLGNTKARKQSWSSSDTTVATVSKKGLVTAVGEGTAQISVKVGRYVSLACEVTVSAVHLEASGSTVLVGGNGAYASVSLEQMLREECHLKKAAITWEVSNPLMGSVKNGLYSAVMEGTNVITGKCGPYVKTFQVKSVKWNVHRGYNDIKPENTMEAFQAAIDYGCYCIETDVRFTKDGVPVIFHDRDVAAMTDGTGKVDKLTLEQIQQLHVDNGNGIETCQDTHIPLLTEVLSLCRRYHIVVMLEIKPMAITDEKEIAKLCQNMYDALESTGMLGQVIVVSARVNLIRIFRSVAGTKVYSGTFTQEEADQLCKEGYTEMKPWWLGNPFGVSGSTDEHPIVPSTGKPWRSFRSG